MNRIHMAAFTIVLIALAAHDSRADSIQQQVAAVDDGRVSMTYDTAPGVCGDGRGSISFGRDHHTQIRLGKNSVYTSDNDGWENGCVAGPVNLMVYVRRGEVTRVRVRVGGGWRAHDDVTDLGAVEPKDAVEFLLTVVREGRSDAADEAVLPTLLARDVVVWPDLIKIARDRSVTSAARKSCVFWLGHIAGEKATEGLVDLVDDDDLELEVRKSAVFALSQQDNSASVAELVTIARTNRHPQIRRSALFWLAQSDDPRVLDIFEDILSDSD